ncbi:ATP-binding protein [Croceicoccus naphthovorans]|uniref:Histidine kinase/HSP90-like ATPase domain-containing protein n=1 Tax=Croceicoccus naphthovorans TaxID=1348774 RepID=A0A0G3XJA2_9SPHN|nr:ATP-binding protein [Croceicoccus naphthovorans]AKM10679.1 hypothetical protein AB433_13010 [Croceicoccus naphthovorans]MBB3988916.1 serine/threonine-protein kinase RsbW [Croceicoccus naphthovorans]
MPFAADPQISVPATLLAVRALSDFLRDRCLAAGIDEGAAMELDLALVEAANNIVQHGLAGAADKIGLSVDLTDETATLVLTDGGPPAPADLFISDAAAPDPLAESGRGMMIMHQCVDSVAYDSEGGVNTLTLTKRLLPG